MLASLFRAEVPVLVAALSAPALLARYQGELAEERAISAERSLAEHLQRMSRLAGQAVAEGFEVLARDDRAGADLLLTDLFAVATWRGWELPVEALGGQELDAAGLVAGLLASGTVAEGAALYHLDAGTLALVRGRAAAGEVLREGHPRA
ncbi:MAG: hypothetical protein L6R48_09305 [Planctomycetes bacterium]|nr:hypothetical protein [Planctomycetota bacterium]